MEARVISMWLLLLLPPISWCRHASQQNSSTTDEVNISFTMSTTIASLSNTPAQQAVCHGISFGTFIRMLDDQTEFHTNIYSSQMDRSCYCEKPSAVLTCPIECTVCESSTRRCLIQNMCCPDDVADNNETTSLDIDTDVKSEDMINECLELERGMHYLVMRSCPVGYDDNVTRTLCEEDLLFDNITIATLLVVTDEATNVTYFNKYCALCNNVTQIQPWRPVIHCYTTFKMLSALTKEDYVRLSMYENEDCYIRQHPYDLNTVTCYPEVFKKENVIDCCNVTGQEIVDHDVEDMCVKTPRSFNNRVSHGKEVYSNIHCLICNMALVKSQRRFDCFKFVGVDRAPFRFLFGLGDSGFYDRPDLGARVNRDGIECQGNEWLDPQNNCRRLECTAGKLLHGNYCETALVDEIKGLPYRTGLFLIPQRHSFHSPDTMRQVSFQDVSQAIADAVKDLFTSFVKKVDIHMGVYFAEENITSQIDVKASTYNATDTFAEYTFMMPQLVWIKLYIHAAETLTRDNVENGMIDALNISSINISSGGQYDTTFDIQFIYEASFDVDSSCQIVSNTSACHTSQFYYSRSRETLARVPRPIGVIGLTVAQFVEMLPYLACPYVELQYEEVKETIEMLPVPRVSKIVLRFGGSTYEIEESALLKRIARGQNGVFYVCLDVLQSEVTIDKVKPSALDELFNTIQYVLTIVCVTISLLCLSATVLTYIIFSNLRNVAGCNTLGLSCSLMAAQILLFVANDIQGPSALCTTIGIITHYSWLVMLSWTFLCCLNILKVFTGLKAQARNSAKQDKKTIAANLIAALLTPAVIVAFIIGGYTIVFDGERYGYGYRTCAMDSPFAIHGPLIFVITCNIVFFVVVVCKIWGVRRLQGNTEKQDRNDFIVYIKLSTLTGMFWLLVVLGEVFYNDIVRCFAVIFNGCQGIFIFVSFIANRRVMNMYLNKFHGE